MVYRRKGRQERGSTREVKTRIPIEEYKEWKRRAELLDITIASYIRDCVRKGNVNVIIKKEIEITPLVEIAAQYGRIGNNINQIAHHLNSGAIWTKRVLKNLNNNLDEMYRVTKRLSKVVDEINGDYKTQSNEKFKL